ncbi:MAG: DUF3370 domain-containing protein [Candidatus Obscuribacterales bacterium]|nr:DUF3370 domain-containing protein [Candidatus Obscuribacterales bacterium]
MKLCQVAFSQARSYFSEITLPGARAISRNALGFASLLLFLTGTFKCGAAYAEQATDSVNLTKPEERAIPFDIRALNGKLDSLPLFNSNMPEVVPGQDGAPRVLLSTLAAGVADFPDAHLSYRFRGKFGVFIHHINKQDQSPPKLLRLSLYAQNESVKQAHIKLLKRSTYLSQPDAPFVKDIPDLERLGESGDCQIKARYAGPGDRLSYDFATGIAQKDYRQGSTKVVECQPLGCTLLENLDVPTRALTPALNGRSYIGWFETDRPLRLFLISSFVDNAAALGQDQPLKLAMSIDRPLPRESAKHFPSNPDAKGGIIYGRVAGVSKGLTFKSYNHIDIKNKALSLAFPVSTLKGGTFGLGNGSIQAAPMYRRYFDTAYRAQGNYAVYHKLSFRIENKTDCPRLVKLSFVCPLKKDGKKVTNLHFLEGDLKTAPVFYRGTVKLTEDKKDTYFHIVLHRGQKSDSLKELQIEPYDFKDISIEFLYPPDATPPQAVLFESAL